LPQRKRKPKATKRSVGKPSAKTARKSASRPARKSVKKSAKKSVRKPVRKSLKKTSKKAQRSSGKRKRVGADVRESSRQVAKQAASKHKAVKTTKKAKLRHSPSRIEQLRAMLEAKRAEITEAIKLARMDGMDIDRTSFPEVGDLVSASVEKERAFEHGEAGVNALREIDTALEKLKEGTYGVCELCGKPVGLKRLKVVPSARLCIRCKAREEASGGLPNRRSSKYGN
jgi:DnaK suppressor protein